jgi:hypothetical protein
MRRSPILIASVCAVVALLVPGAAQASRTQTLTFEAPRDLKDPSTRDQAFKDIAALGVHSMRLVLYWHDVAPQPDSRVKPKFDETDPGAYDWSAYDAVVNGIKARGWSLLLTVSGPVPRWATNGARGQGGCTPAEPVEVVAREQPLGDVTAVRVEVELARVGVPEEVP